MENGFTYLHHTIMLLFSYKSDNIFIRKPITANYAVFEILMSNKLNGNCVRNHN